MNLFGVILLLLLLRFLLVVQLLLHLQLVLLRVVEVAMRRNYRLLFLQLLILLSRLD